MSETKVTNTRLNTKLNPWSAKVFINADKHKLEIAINGWFDGNKIYRLNFVSKAWGFLTRHRNKVMSQQIRQAMQLSDVVKVQFSHKCGCRCGCSPGFNIKSDQPLPQQYQRSHVWVKIGGPGEVNDDEIEQLLIRANEILKQELKQHNV